MKAELIAPCGMNCNICMGYLREKNRCAGCLVVDPYTRSYHRKCVIRSCEHIQNSESGYCYECPEFPCRRMKQLDKRYTTKYNMSMLENLDIIEKQGMQALLDRETEKWKCPECGGVTSCHNGRCYTCTPEKRPGKASSGK